MTAASELFKQGRLKEALDTQIQEVKARPGDHGKRLFLFELLALAGDLERAKRQIDAVKYDDPEIEAATQTYRQLLQAEQYRRRVFAEGVMPQFLTAPPAWLGKRLEAVQALRGGQQAEAARLLAEADQAAPPVKGTLNGKAFEVIRDADDLFGPVLEVLAHGDYYWLPLEQVEVLAANPPRFPRDLLWFPARVEVREGPRGDVFLPALYPGSHEHPDDQVKLGRSTDWKQAEGGPVLGVGGRTFLVGDDAVHLPAWRELQTG